MRQFIRLEGERSHSGESWLRIWCGEAFIRKPGEEGELYGYRAEDILRLCHDGDMEPTSIKVTHWMPATFPKVSSLASEPSGPEEVKPTPSNDGVTELPSEEWQPIETAPKDGTYVLLFGEHSRACRERNRQLTARWDGRDWESADDGYGIYLKPTHWMPLPTAPSEATR